MRDIITVIMDGGREKLGGFFRGRIGLFKICLFLAFFVIVGRLFFVQIVQHNYYVAKANARQMKSYTIS